MSAEEEAARPRCPCHDEPMFKAKKRKDGSQAFSCRVIHMDAQRASRQENKDHNLARVNAWRKKNPAKKAVYQMRRFGVEITEEDYHELMRRSGGKCEICLDTPADKRGNTTLCIDHDHETKEVRGLLCRKCNVGVGVLGDTHEHLERALDYLLRSVDVLGSA